MNWGQCVLFMYLTREMLWSLAAIAEVSREGDGPQDPRQKVLEVDGMPCGCTTAFTAPGGHGVMLSSQSDFRQLNLASSVQMMTLTCAVTVSCY